MYRDTCQTREKGLTDPELFEDAGGMWYAYAGQDFSGAGTLGGSSEGCVYVELTSSGAKWGRGPVYGDIHGGRKRAVDSPARRRHCQLEAAGGRVGR